MQRADPRVAEVVKAGEIRIALFLPQYIKNPLSENLQGVGTGFIAIDIATVLSAELAVESRLVGLPTPAAAVACLKARACDVAFLGIEPSRVVEVDFSPPLFQFDYTYLVPAGSTIDRANDADRPGIRIAVVSNHASDLALRRKVMHAELVGAEIPDGAFALLADGKVDAFALPRDHLLDYSKRLPGSRVLEDRYGINRVGMAVPKGSEEWLSFLSEFAEASKASGLIARSIERVALRGFEVSPPH